MLSALVQPMLCLGFMIRAYLANTLFVQTPLLVVSHLFVSIKIKMFLPDLVLLNIDITIAEVRDVCGIHAFSKTLK